MKKHYYTLGLTTLALAFVIPLFSHSTARAESLVETEGSAGINASLQTQGGPGPASIRDRIRTDIEVRNTNAINNRDIRNTTLEGRLSMNATTSTSTPPHFPPPRHGDGNGNGQGDDGNEPGDGRPPKGFGTTTPPGMGRGHDGPGEGDEDNASSTDKDGHEGTKNMLKVHKDVFENQKAHLVDQLNRALENLKQVRGRIADRITKAETSGRDMTKAKALLVTADGKIGAAQIAITALANVSATTTGTTTASTTVIVDLGKPRQVGAAAIKAVNDAKKALNDVVVAIAHGMGFKVGIDGHIEDEHGTTTPPGGGTTGTTTATTTASSTP